MLLVGLTGGIATGKSTVSNFLKEQGFTIVDGDEIARLVVKPGWPALDKIRKTFGDSIMLPSGEMDRQAVGDIIFQDVEKRKLLNSIVHPEIYKEVFRQILKCLWRREHIVFLDMPLLYESGKMLPYLTCVVVVACRPEQQLNRLMDRNSLSEKDALARISSQMSLAEKCAKADFVIDNSSSREETKRQITLLIDTLYGQYKPFRRYTYVDLSLLLLGSLFGSLLWKILS